MTEGEIHSPEWPCAVTIPSKHFMFGSSLGILCPLLVLQMISLDRTRRHMLCRVLLQREVCLN